MLVRCGELAPRVSVGQRLAYTLALQRYDATEHPRDLAGQYDKVQKREATLTVPGKKRPR